MLKRLRIYYFYVALPFVALLTGAAIYHQQIARTITANPHPQINYAIFAIIIMGGMLILRGVHRLMQEVRALARFSDAVRSKMPQAELQEMTINLDVDIAYVLRMLAATSKEKTITHQEQFALENELSKSRSRLASRTALPQFLSGLLVGMGLLGTFIGLLATLSDISLLISSFADINMTTANPLDVFRNMIERMKAPMQSMGIAFSASLFGLLGSIILGLMMVGVRRCMGDLMSLLGSEVAQQIELSLANDGFAYSKSALKQGVAFSGDSAARNSVEALAKSLHCTLIRIEPHTFDRTVNINWLISWYQNKDINQCQAIRKKWKNFWHTALSIQFFQAIDSMGRPERPPGRLRHWWVNYFVSNSVESSPTNNTCEFPSLLRQATPHTEN